jgi:hypothetical protein
MEDIQAVVYRCQDWAERQLRLIDRLRIESSPPAILTAADAGRIQQNVTRRMRKALFMNHVESSVGAIAALAVLAIVVGIFAWWQSGNVDIGALGTALDQKGLDEDLLKAVNAGDGNAILPWAAARGYLEIVELLLDAGADVTATMSTGGITAKEEASALHFAAGGKHIETVELLIDRGADVNSTEGTFGESALHGAADENFAEMVALLLANGADPDLQSSIGDTPLHAAARTASIEAAQVLIEHGAALDIESKQGWTALDVSASDEFDKMRRAAGATE